MATNFTQPICKCTQSISRLLENALANGAYRAVKKGTYEDQVTVCTVQGELIEGVIISTSDPSLTIAANTQVTLARKGMIPVQAGAAISAGVRVTVDNAGRFITATTNDFTAGKSMSEATALGDIITVDLDVSNQSDVE